MLRTFKRLIRDEQGITAIEYGLMAVVIALVMVLGATILGNSLSNVFSFIGGQV